MWREREAVLETYQADETFTLTDLPWVSVKHPRIHYPIIR